MKRKYQDDISRDNEKRILKWMDDSSKEINNYSENLSPENSSGSSEKEESYTSTGNNDNNTSTGNNDNNTSTGNNDNNTSTGNNNNNTSTTNNNINTATNQNDRLAEAKQNSLNNIDVTKSDNGVTMEDADEWFGKLDKGSGQLSNKLNEVKEHRAENDLWSDNACEASDGNYQIYSEKECQGFAKKAHNDAQESAKGLVDSVKDLIDNSTDLNDIALSPEVVNVCNWASKFAEWLS